MRGENTGCFSGLFVCRPFCVLGSPLLLPQTNRGSDEQISTHPPFSSIHLGFPGCFAYLSSVRTMPFRGNNAKKVGRRRGGRQGGRKSLSTFSFLLALPPPPPPPSFSRERALHNAFGIGLARSCSPKRKRAEPNGGEGGEEGRAAAAEQHLAGGGKEEENIRGRLVYLVKNSGAFCVFMYWSLPPPLLLIFFVWPLTRELIKDAAPSLPPPSPSRRT